MPQPTVLIAEDQRHIRVLLESCLAPIGCRILTVSSGEEALVAAASTPIDLLLIDFEMARLTGVQTVQQLKRLPAYAKLPVIMITGRGQNRIRVEAIAAGVTVVVTKPFSPAELLESVRRLLAGSENAARAD